MGARADAGRRFGTSSGRSYGAKGPLVGRAENRTGKLQAGNAQLGRAGGGKSGLLPLSNPRARTKAGRRIYGLDPKTVGLLRGRRKAQLRTRR